MRVIPEDVLLDFLARCLKLMGEILPELLKEGSSPIPKDLQQRFAQIIGDIHRQKRNDSVLADESWEWIWEVRSDMNRLQLFGRLSWLNYNLFDLL